MPDAIVMRHRTPHFAHVFSGDGYSAGYYSYLWSEMLDADGFGAFEENGIFDPATAESLRRNVLAAGNTRPPEEAYIAFRGPDAIGRDAARAARARLKTAPWPGPRSRTRRSRPSRPG